MDGVSALGEALDALAADELALLSDGFLSSELVELDRLRNRLDAEILRRRGEWDTRSAWGHDGALSGAAWLGRRCRVRLSAARTELRLAAQLRTTMALAAEALADGEINTDHVRVLAKGQSRAPEAFAAAEEMLVGHARQLRPEDLHRVVRHWLNHVDPDGSHQEARDDHAGRGADASETFGGATILNGIWFGDQGQLIKRAIAAYYELEWRADQARPPIERRTPKQLRADAIAALCQAALDLLKGETRSRRARPLITLIFAADQIFSDHPPGDTPGDTPGDAAPGDASGDLLSRLGHSTLPPDTLRRLCCDATIARAILDADGHVLDLGRSVRTFTYHQHHALALRDRHCAFPTCDRPPEWCDGHHIHHWEAGGPTDLWNGLLLCKTHHTLVHEGGFTIRHASGPTLEFRRPDGTLIERRPWTRSGGAGGGGPPPP